jgi:hypothetical protein
VKERLLPRARAARSRATLEREYWSFRRRYGAVLRPAPPTRRGIALLASLSFSTYQVKLEGMFAKAFQLQGLEPVVVTLPDARLARRYLELFGVRRFVTLDDYLDDELEATARREAAALLERVSRPDDLRELRFHGADVGREALSTISRYLHEGRVDLDDARARELLAELLPAAVRTALGAEALLDDLRPDLVLFNERNYADQGPLCDVAVNRGLNVVQFVAGFEDDTMVFKRYTAETKGIHPRSLSDESWPRVAAMPWNARHERELADDFERRYDKTATYFARWNQGWTERRSRDDIVAQLGLDPARPTAVVFSHVLWDANMFYGRDLFADQEEWFVETVRAACRNEHVNWVVKLHPANVWKRRRDNVSGELDELTAIRERVGALPQHVHLLLPDTTIATWSLFDLTDWGLTIRGSVGFELPCFGKPVLTAGTGFYSGRGFTVDSETADEYLARLAAIQEIRAPSEEQVVLARKHAYALFRLRQTRFTSFRSVFVPVERIGRPSEATIELRVTSPEELRESHDLRRLGEWTVGSRSLDYLEPVAAPEEAPERVVAAAVSARPVGSDGRTGKARVTPEPD